MQKKYRVLLTFISLLFVLSCAILVNYQKYLKEKNDYVALVDVQEGLSVNYGEGKYVVVNSKEREVSFSVTNLTEEKKSYTIYLENYTGVSDGASYTLIESDVTLPNKIDSNGGSVSNITVLAGETKRYRLKIDNPNDKTFSFYIRVSVNDTDESFYSIILKNNELKDNSVTSFEAGSNDNEGLIKKEEENGTSYYFRGNINNNYVQIDDMVWRIVKVNTDGTVKLILDGVTEDLIPFNSNELKGNTNFFQSNVYTSLMNWYENKLKNYENFIASPNYCFDNSILEENDTSTTYLAGLRLFSDHLPTNTCSGDFLSLKIGLLTADEANYAGLSQNENKNNYLALDGLENSWWTMTPSKKENSELKLIVVNKDSKLESDISETNSLFIRPVISLMRKVSVSGTGTKESPYAIVE